MPGFPSPLTPAAVASRLRAAGCVFADEEARLLVSAARTPAELAAMADRRADGSPLEHVLGWADFCGLRIAVDPGVFVPRRRTEFLVRQAAALIHGAGHAGHAAGKAGPAYAAESPPAAGADRGAATERAAGRPVVVLDLCCGSGAVGAALAAALGSAELHAADIDPAAVACARRNVAPAGGRVHQGDLFGPLPAALRGRVDVLAVNVPYVPTGEIALLPAEARVHEPRIALDGGADGLDVLRRVAAGAPRWLAPGGHLLTETSDRQAWGAADILAASGLTTRVVSSEEFSATVVIGTTRPAA